MKTSCIILFISILVGFSIGVPGQESAEIKVKSHSFGLQFGLNQMKEMNLLPLVHRGTLTSFSYESEKRAQNFRQFQFSLNYSRIKTGLEEFPKSANLRFRFYYSTDFLIFQNNKIRYYAGPALNLNYSLMLYPDWDESHLYWADFLTIGPTSILLVKQKKDREFLGTLNFPLLGIFSRPNEIRNFKIDNSSFTGILSRINGNLEPGFLNKLMHLDFNAEYRFPISAAKKQAITWTVDFIRIAKKDEPAFSQLINRIGLKIML